MKTLSEILDSFVLKLKNKEEFAHLKFVHGGKARRAEAPVMSEILACSVGKVSAESKSGGVCWEPQLEFVLYAPLERGSREVSKSAHAIARCIWQEDAEGLVKSMSLSSADYSGELSAFSQTITVKLKVSGDTDAGSGEAVNTAMVYVNSEKLAGVVKASVIHNHNVYRVRELLAGETSAVPVGVSYIIKLTLRGTALDETRYKNFVITLRDGNRVASYTDCIITEVSQKYYDDEYGAVREYTVLAQDVRNGG